MNPLLLARSAKPFKKELAIVSIVMFSLFALPVMAIASVTNLGALADAASNQLYSQSASPSNKYAYGNCTYWTSERREKVGKPIPQYWGDAHSWDDNARIAGYVVDHNPEKYAIMQTDAGDLGHVAFVEEVRDDGKWVISEMNAVGWDIVSPKTYTAEDAKSYNFIH